MVEYHYDSWGNVIDISGDESLGRLNPFRYRGYYYDEETGMYYLKSRYYDPEIGRFICADETSVLMESPMSLTDKNLYAYCDNNPVVFKDNTGAIAETVFDIVSLGFSIAEVAANPYDIGAWAGLVGDAIDLIPIVTGVGETIRGIRMVDKVGNTLEIAKAVDFTDDTKKTIAVCVAYIYFIMKYVQWIKWNRKDFRVYIPGIILGLWIIGYFVFPMNLMALKMNLYIFQEKRTELIKLIEEDEANDEEKYVNLNKTYRSVSADGEIAIYQNDEYITQVGFWYQRGLFNAGASLLLYVSPDDKFEWNDRWGIITGKDRLKENWYFVTVE